MRRLNDSIIQLIEANQTLSTGIRNKLFNLSQLSRFIKPQLEVRLRKEITESSILMALSRYQSSLDKVIAIDDKNKIIQGLSVFTDLGVITFLKSKKIHEAIMTSYDKVIEKVKVFNVTEGITEITLITDYEFIKKLPLFLKKNIKTESNSISCIAVQLTNESTNMRGTFYFIFQELYFQGINIVEIASTGTELLIYLKNVDTELALETIYKRFLGN